MVPPGAPQAFQSVQRLGTRIGITFDVTVANLARPEAIIAAPTAAQKHVWRAKFILLSGDGWGTVAA